MKSDAAVPVAIVGGGASGTILAAQLAQRGIESALIDGSGRAGRGVAYSTTEPAHLLNVRAEGMSAWAGEPDHFAERFEAEGGDRRGFAQRRLFGRYLGEILDEAVASGRTNLVRAHAVTAQRTCERWRIGLDDGSTVEAGAVALAIGNQEPEGLRAFDGAGKRYVANPWGDEARAAVRDLAASGGDALLIGTGLTMVDLVLSLDAAGHQGAILALSRRGQAPRAHADFEPAPVEADEVPHGRLSAMWRWLRRKSAEVGWRAAVDSLRPHSHPLWQSLDSEEQRRFLRHARPWWDVHRHRIAPEVAATIARLVGEGRLEIMAGRIVAAAGTPDGIDVELRRRGEKTQRRRTFAYAFNCTGPLHTVDHTRDPLLRSLLDAGETRPDQLGIGLEVDDKCRAGERLWALGPLTKGRYWEIIAVPDIREQAAEIAEDMARELQA
jgi:uncharacterized NAD(P)/FAD-binding protein YdhS